jgi:hypothetical protein
MLIAHDFYFLKPEPCTFVHTTPPFGSLRSTKAGLPDGPAPIAAAKDGIPSLTDAAFEANGEELLRLD